MSAISSVGGKGASSRTLSISLTSSCSFFSKVASLNLVAWVVFAFVVLLRKKYGGGGDNGGAEGVTGWKMFCDSDNGGAVGVRIGLSVGGGGSGGDFGGTCEGGSGGGGRKFELKLFPLFFKASSLDWISISTRFGAFFVRC